MEWKKQTKQTNKLESKRCTWIKLGKYLNQLENLGWSSWLFERLQWDLQFNLKNLN